VFNWFNSKGDREIGPFFCALFFAAYARFPGVPQKSPTVAWEFFLEISRKSFFILDRSFYISYVNQIKRC